MAKHTYQTLENVKVEFSNLNNSERGLHRKLEELCNQENIVKNNILDQAEQINTLHKSVYSANAELKKNENSLDSEQTKADSIDKDLQEVKAEFDILCQMLEEYRALEENRISIEAVFSRAMQEGQIEQTSITKDMILSYKKAEFDDAISKVININFQDADGKTLLMHACSNGFLYAIDKLLEIGADPNIVDNKGVNALMWHASYPHSDYIKKLAEKTSNLNRQTNIEKNNVLHYLIVGCTKIAYSEEFSAEEFREVYSMGSFNITLSSNITIDKLSVGVREDGYTLNQLKTLRLINYFVAKGVNINTQNAKGLTPLFLACATKQKYLASQMLEKYDMDYSLLDYNNQGLIHWIFELRDTALLENALSKPTQDINYQDINGLSLLHWAVKYNDQKMAQFLLSRGAKADISDKWGMMPIHLTVGKGKELVDILSAYTDINIRSTNHEKYTLAHLAAQAGDVEMLRLLKTKNADFNLLEKSKGISVLLSSVGSSKVEAVKFLLENGARADLPSAEGLMPIHYAAINKLYPIVDLLSNYTNINTKTVGKNQWNIVYLAAQQGDIILLELAKSKGADLDTPMLPAGITPLQQAISKMQLEAVKFLVESGADKNKVDEGSHKATPLYYSLNFSGNHDYRITKYLVECGADVNKAMSDGDTPIHMTGYHALFKVAELLIRRGAFETINSSNQQGKTPICCLIETTLADSEDKVKTLKVFLKHDASITNIDGQGHDAKHFADQCFPEANYWLEHRDQIDLGFIGEL